MNEEQKSVYKFREEQVAYDIGTTAMARKNGKYKGILVFIAVIAVIVIIALLAYGCEGSGKTGNNYPSDDFIAKVEVEGTIAANSKTTGIFESSEGYDHAWTVSTIDELIDEDSNKGLILYVNTPGGSVYETDELYLKIREYQEKTKRPVYAVMGNIAASGGYYISAPCDKILANRNTWTGSIGVTMGNIMDFSGFLNEHGVKVNTITSGPNKAMGNRLAPMTEEQRAIFQSLVDEAYDQFAGIVAEGRKMDIAEVKRIADGRIYTAKQAKNVNLIDEICTYEEAESIMRKENKLQDARIVNLNEEAKGLHLNLFGKMNFAGPGNGILSMKDKSVIDEMLGKKSRIEAMYYCEELAD